MHYKIPVIFLSIFSVFWLVGSSYCYVCNVRQNCHAVTSDEKEVDDNEAVSIPSIVISDGDSFQVTTPGDFYFLYNTDSLISVQSAAKAWNELSDYLSQNPEKNLVVTGHYAESESRGAQLGLNRSTAFVDFLSEKYGLNHDRFKSAFEMNEGVVISEDSTKLYGALSFAFNIDKAKLEDKASSELDLKALETDLEIARRVYFDFGSSFMKADPALHQFFTDLKFYLDETENSRVALTGHTDNVGSPAKNRALSLERAKDVRRYLIENNGFAENDFVLEAKGEKVPLVSNDTDPGRAKNRRVEIKLAN
ncbi:MAG TPA: OmpA family protein [Saprospiraceae bacterium]|nr:OmpA family protein [Saprospiraceae bacterium]